MLVRSSVRLCAPSFRVLSVSSRRLSIFPSLPKLQGSFAPLRFSNGSFRLFSQDSSAATGSEEHREQGEGRADRAVGAWLFACTGLVFGMVVLGGLTRLTKSGLSMVEWKFTGERPPMTEDDWLKEFDKYRSYPEYQKLNRGMSMNEFKFIYWMEWSHRMLGRTVGLVFGLPLVYFMATRRLQRRLIKPLVALFFMGGAQGLIGWWMVKSGLQQPKSEFQEPKVSPYRLAVHMFSAVVIYSLLFATALRAWKGRPMPAVPGGVPPAVRQSLHAVKGLIGLMIISGAFVAGHQAGLIYNEFPLMGGRLIPQDLIRPDIEPKWKNFTENSTAVQFLHRVLGVSTWLAIGYSWLRVRRIPNLSRTARTAGNLLFGMASLQVGLGISTLLLHVPVPLAAAHQAGALLTLTSSLWLLYVLGPSSRTLAKQGATAAAAARAAAVTSAMSFTSSVVVRGQLKAATSALSTFSGTATKRQLAGCFAQPQRFSKPGFSQRSSFADGVAKASSSLG